MKSLMLSGYEAMHHNAWVKASKVLSHTYWRGSVNSMKGARNSIRSEQKLSPEGVKEGEISVVDLQMDNHWTTRGTSSQDGVLVSMVDNRVIDCQVMRKDQTLDPERHKILKERMFDHRLNEYNSFTKLGNYFGTSPYMETAGTVRSFNNLYHKDTQCDTVSKDGDVGLKKQVKDYNNKKKYPKKIVDTSRTSDLGHYQQGSKKFIRSDAEPPKALTAPSHTATNSATTSNANTNVSLISRFTIEFKKHELKLQLCNLMLQSLI